MRDFLWTHWINVPKTLDESKLWAHEWDKHGTCAKDNAKLGSQFQYFQESHVSMQELLNALWLKTSIWCLCIGLQLKTKYSIYSFLESARITPSLENAHSFADLSKAIRDQIGKNLALKCWKDNRDGRFYIKEVNSLLYYRLLHKNTDLLMLTLSNTDKNLPWQSPTSDWLRSHLWRTEPGLSPREYPLPKTDLKVLRFQP